MKDADRIPSNRFTGACSIAALASCACLVACTPEDVVVFIVPDAHEDPSPPGSGGATNRPNDSAHGGSSVEGGGAGGAQSDSTAAGGEGAGGEADSSSDHHNGGRTCASNDDCPGSWFCAKSSCDAETGVCEVPPANCPDESRADHVCGCDGAMYWSDCVRKQNLVPASKKDYCSADARPCSTHEDCAQFGGFCARLTFGSVDCSDVGTCWGLPSSCPSPDLRPVFRLGFLRLGGVPKLVAPHDVRAHGRELRHPAPTAALGVRQLGRRRLSVHRHMALRRFVLRHPQGRETSHRP